MSPGDRAIEKMIDYYKDKTEEISVEPEITSVSPYRISLEERVMALEAKDKVTEPKTKQDDSFAIMAVISFIGYSIYLCQTLVQFLILVIILMIIALSFHSSKR